MNQTPEMFGRIDPFDFRQPPDRMTEAIKDMRQLAASNPFLKLIETIGKAISQKDLKILWSIAHTDMNVEQFIQCSECFWSTIVEQIDKYDDENSGIEILPGGEHIAQVSSNIMFGLTIQMYRIEMQESDITEKAKSTMKIYRSELIFCQRGGKLKLLPVFRPFEAVNID